MFDEKAMKIMLLQNDKTIDDWASFLGIDKATLYRKMSGISDFWRNEIQRTCDFFGEKELNAIFFADEVTQTKHAHQDSA